MRLTTDVLADDGSAAMTAVSSASLALTSAGVQLSAPVAGLQQCIMLACILCSQCSVWMTGKPFTCKCGVKHLVFSYVLSAVCVLSIMACSCCAGVTLGLLAREGEGEVQKWELVTDPGSLEEGLGPMQLHAAGTSHGFTALQLACNGSGAGDCLQVDMLMHASLIPIHSLSEVAARRLCFLHCYVDQAGSVLACKA